MKFRYPGDKKVTFASRLPRLHPETPVEDWLQRDFQVKLKGLERSSLVENVRYKKPTKKPSNFILRLIFVAKINLLDFLNFTRGYLF